MRLLSLIVYKNGKLLREVPFKRGLNLILNKASGKEKSGNSVGKSTPSRLLDYLFLSSGEDIYIDAEFKKVIPEVYDFINNNNILIELSFIGHDQQKYVVSRLLLTDPKESTFLINEIPVTKSEYQELIAIQIFGQRSEKPSVRNLSHKFIRNTNEKMQNTTRLLNKHAKPDTYDQLYLFLFGFSGLSLLENKASFNNQISTKKKHLAAYRVPHKESALRKMVKPLTADEEALEGKIKSFNFKDSQESSVKNLVGIQEKISKLTIDYSKVFSRINYLSRSVENLKVNTAKVDDRELSTIYSDAGVSINGHLKRSYEELVVFHNTVISNKISLITIDINSNQLKADALRKDIDALHESESALFKSIGEPDVLKSIGQMYNDLSKIRKQITSVKVSLEKIESTKKAIEDLKGDKRDVVKAINQNTTKFDNNVELFNEYFSGISKYFYNESYLFDLEFDSEKEKCTFDITCVAPNSTGGKKKGELTAFDFAYIEFVNASKLKRPTFIIHDSIEDVDVNQIHDIFQKASHLDGQYIVAVLSDKIAGSNFSALKEESTILELSETDKFFKF